MAGTDLKPCPFCGGEAKLYSIGTGSPHYGHYHQVVCQGCLTASGAYWSGEQSAIDAWNTRYERTCYDRNASAREHGAYLFMWRCSNCDESYDTEMSKPNYCPNCGAKVVSE